MKIKNPPLRYHGSKWRIADWIISHFPEHKIYCEPFSGSGAILFKKSPSRIEVYNDMDSVVVNFFRVLQCPVKSKMLIELVARTPYSRDEYDLAFTDCDDSVEMARRLFIKAYMGFGSNAGTRRAQCGFRCNDWAAHKANNLIWFGLPESLSAAALRLKNIIIENRPALFVIEKQDSPETLFYVDPPYVHSSRTSFTINDHSYKHEMNDTDHINLAAALHGCKAAVIISGYRTDLYDDLYKDWIRREKMAMTQANAKNKYRMECIWINPKVEEINKERLFK